MELEPLVMPEPFDLRAMARSHGWVKLEPFAWDEEAGALSHTLTCRSGVVCTWRVEPEAADALRLYASAHGPFDAAEEAEVVAAARWTLRLDEEFAGFHTLCAQHPGLQNAAQNRLGRLLRSPTLWEDAAKTILTTCTTWERTRAMVAALCRTWGAPAPDGAGFSFPSPRAIAAASEAELRQEAGLGYRARYLHALARAADGLEPLKQDPRPTEAVRAALLALPGIGPYGAANLLALLGRYDYIALDSWVRRVVGKGWFAGREVSDREILAAFTPFGPWKALVYWFWDWDSAAEEWSWREESG